MQPWIELPAQALDRSNTFPLEQVLEPAVNGLETLSQRRRRFLDMLKRKLKAVGQLEQREDDRALSSLSRICPLILYALAIILEIRQGTQIHLVLLTQLLLEPFDFRAFRTRRRSNVMCCFHNRGSPGLFEFRINDIVRASWTPTVRSTSAGPGCRSLAVSSRRKRMTNLLQIARELPQFCKVRDLILHLCPDFG